jgi:hypothetical protein
LIKAREAKAMDDGMKGGVGGTKRKSEDMLDTAITTDQHEKNKKAKMAENSVGVADETNAKSGKGSKGKSGQRQSPFHLAPVLGNITSTTQQSENIDHVVSVTSLDEQDGMLDRFKRTVEGLGARVGKSVGKSLGGAAAATALAEARAAAEARVMERERKELCEGTSPVFVDHESQESVLAEPPMNSPHPPRQSNIRFSVSDLVSTFEKKDPIPPPSVGDNTSRISSHSVPSSSVSDAAPSASVFSQTFGPVFKPPVPKEKAPPNHSSSNVFSRPSAMTGGHPEKLDHHNDVASSIPSTEDTDYSAFRLESQPPMNETDDDDSWPLAERLAAGPQWTFGTDETMAWSTLTESRSSPFVQVPQGPAVPETLEMDVDPVDVEDVDLASDEEIPVEKSTVSLVDVGLCVWLLINSMLMLLSCSSIKMTSWQGHRVSCRLFHRRSQISVFLVMQPNLLAVFLEGARKASLRSRAFSLQQSRLRR